MYAQPIDAQIESPILVSEYLRIYETFIKPGSEYELNLPHVIVENVKEAIEKKEYYCTSCFIDSLSLIMLISC